jgi:signal transduction histidine kinase
MNPDSGSIPDTDAGVGDRMGDWRQRLNSAVDPILVVTVVLSVAAIVEVLAYTDKSDSPATQAFALALNLSVTLSVAMRNWHLIRVAVVATICTLVLVAFPPPITVATVCAELILLYQVAGLGRRGVTVLFGLPFLVLAFPFGPRDRTVGLVVFGAVAFALLVGDAFGQRTRAVTERDASVQAMKESERERVVIEERTRIARELHDVVAHHLSMIAVQAESAALARPGLDDETREEIGAIAETARDALTEMRRLLGLLRTDGQDPSPREPQPGLELLADLIDDTRRGGLPVTLRVSGSVTPLPDGVDLAAYRIVQEALTNVRRHAGGSDAEVDLEYEQDWLHVHIRDHGPGAVEGKFVEGHGLAGMKERVSMAGGVLRAGTHPDGGFVVDADLPLSVTS